MRWLMEHSLRREEGYASSTPKFLPAIKSLLQFFARKSILIGCSVTLFALLIINAECYRRITSLTESRSWVEHTYRVLAEIARAETALARLEQSHSAMASQERTAQSSIRFEQIKKEAARIIKQLGILTQDNPKQQTRLASLAELSQKWAEPVSPPPPPSGPARTPTAQPAPAASTALAARMAALDAASAVLKQMTGEESELLASRQADAEKSSRATIITVTAASLIQIGLLLFSYRILRRDARQSRQDADRLYKALDERKQLLDASADGFFGVDREGRCTFINPAASRMLGYEPGELLGAETHPLIHHSREDGTPYPPDESPIVQTATRGKSDKTGNIDTEVFWRKDWKALPVEYSCQPLSTVEGKLNGAVVAFRDISERRQINAEIQGARDLALQSTQLKSEFLANMSHEIRTPMNAILGLAGLLEETPLDDQQRDFARTILNSADSLLGLINDILDFSKGEAGKLTFESLDFELPSAVEGVVDLVSASARNKQLRLLCTVESNVPRYVRGDAGRLRQVLTNLLSNAIKFTSEGTVSLRVEMCGQPILGDNPGTWLRFSVQDSGLGIDPETQKKLFKPFTQADGSTTRRFGGTGLGLAICKQIVEQMGSPDSTKVPEIQIESRLGSGSTFRFEVYFPQAVCEEKPRLKGKTVLIVDESEVNVRALRNLLEVTSATILTSTSGLHALLLRPPYPFDLAILSMEMVQMNALRLAEALCDANPKTKILFLTSRDPVQLQIDRYPHLREPYPPRALFQQITLLLPAPPPATTTAPVSAIPITTPEVRSEPADGRSLRILLAEDNVTNQKVALHQLQRLGHNAYAVNNGREVLEITERIQYDVILMDCQMPEMDGYEATRQLRIRESNQDVWGGQSPHIWIIALTAHSLTGDREKCLAAGMDDYLSKPARLDAIQEALGRSQSLHVVQKQTAPLIESIREPEVMAPVPLKKAIGQIRLESLKELEELSSDFVQVMTTSFQNEVPPCLQEIRRLSAGDILPAADGAAVARAAHKIKGAGANYGAKELEKLCAQMEAVARAEKIEEVKLLMPELEAEYEAVIVSLNNYLKERPSMPA